MLTSLEIKNFRTFKHLRIERLGQVNLILGKNNVGKTTLLEALQLYGSRWPARTALDILEGRGEIGGTNRPGAVVNLRSLFHGRQAEPGTQSSIGPATNGDGSRVFQVAKIEEDVDYDKALTAGQQPAFSLVPQFAVEYRFGSDPVSTWTILPSRRVHSFMAGPLSSADMTTNPKPPLLRLTSAASMLNETAVRWDSLALTTGEQDVVGLLQTIAPIQGVRYIETAMGRVAIVQIEGKTDPIPLMSQGEGTVHVFQIAVAMVHTAMAWKKVAERDQFPNMFPGLLIDEFEVGVHHTLHADLWRFVLKAARELGVQVFATTHSWDCVRGFAAAVQDVPQCDALAIRLERSRDRSAAVSFTPEEMKIVVREEIEVR